MVLFVLFSWLFQVAINRRNDMKASGAYEPFKGPNPPVIRNNNDKVWVPQLARPRRNRKSEAIRSMVRENIILPSNFIYPLFIHDEVSFHR